MAKQAAGYRVMIKVSMADFDSGTADRTSDKCEISLNSASNHRDLRPHPFIVQCHQTQQFQNVSIKHGFVAIYAIRDCVSDTIAGIFLREIIEHGVCVCAIDAHIAHLDQSIRDH